jgi:hypothetical protein
MEHPTRRLAIFLPTGLALATPASTGLAAQPQPTHKRTN